MMVVMMLRATRRRHLRTPPALSLRQRPHRPPSLPTSGPISIQRTGTDAWRGGRVKEKEGSIGSSENFGGGGRGFVTEGRAL